MLDTKTVSQTLQLLQGAESLLAITHANPDGDAVASLLAMGEIAKRLGKKCRLVCVDVVPKAFAFLPEAATIMTDFFAGDADLIITLDCGDLQRSGFAARLGSRKVPWINIDHHPKNDLHRYATCNLVDYQAASCTQILYELCLACNVLIDPPLATDLFTGLYTDTGSFQHAVTTPAVMNMAAVLLQKGARVREVYKHINQSRSVARLKLWGQVMERAMVNKWGIIVSVVTRFDLMRSRATEEDIAGLVGMLEVADNARAALLLTELPGGYIKGSIRSNNSGIDVSRIACTLGGGGHHRASGFMIKGKFEVDNKRWKVV